MKTFAISDKVVCVNCAGIEHLVSPNTVYCIEAMNTHFDGVFLVGIHEVFYSARFEHVSVMQFVNRLKKGDREV